MQWSTIWQPLSMWTEENLPQLGLLALIIAVIVITGAGILSRIVSGRAYHEPRGKTPRYSRKQLPRGRKGRSYNPKGHRGRKTRRRR